MTSDDRPYATEVDYGEAQVDCDWPIKCGPRQWRGAVIEALSRAVKKPELKWWTQRNSVGENLQSKPKVIYRVHRGRPSVFVTGDESKDLITQLAYHLTSVALPDGEVIPVRGIRTRVYRGECRVIGTGWASYRLTTPYFPSAAVETRRPPKNLSHLDKAWAGFALSSSLRVLIEEYGLKATVTRPIYACPRGELRWRKCEWARPAQGKKLVRSGFRCVFDCNVFLPSGFAIGSKVSEGYGELELLGAWEGVYSVDRSAE